MKTKSGKSESRSHLSPSVPKQKPVTKEGKKAKVKKVMKEWKEGELKTNAGEAVTDQKQAIAIALSESGQSNKDKKRKRRK
ncbi:MAG TPA: DUF6496 domain-containing protein [Bacteroidia bacterium]|jgi:hypothetical protein|nr:DUF6496 domain-containing protein [Bacteroidia bacterium]